MNIVIDTSVLGLAQLYETARTGIYRTISCLSKELLSDSSLEIGYTSLSSIQINLLTDRFFEKYPEICKPFPKNGLEKVLLSLADGNGQSASRKLANKILSRLYRISHTRRIGSSVDIFHSMYSPLPTFRGTDTPLRILTIYDIIPLIHPEYFADGFAEEFRPITASFDPLKDYVITISECTKNDICEYFKMSPERVFVTHLAASTSLYYQEKDTTIIARAKKEYNIPEGRYFLTLATVEKRKNLITSIRAFRRFLHDTDSEDLYFVLVGTKGWKVEELFDLIERDHLLRERVICTGFIPDEDLSAVYSGAVGFLYPSLYEGFGLPPLEAMQCGVPVIASKTTSLPEVIGDAGMLVDPLDEDRIMECMAALLGNAELRQSYSIRGIERAGHFSWKRCAEQTIAAYENIWQQQ